MASSARYRRPATTSTPSAASESGAQVSSAASADDLLAQEKAELEEAVQEQAVKTSNRVSLVDVLRVLGGIALLSCGLSYLSTSGESMTWGYNAWWTRAREWRGLFQNELFLTDAQLASYDGSDPSLPILLALNGTIYDVSSSPSTYGPGGSYHFFAGRDAARAFLTGCFGEDSVPDLRGVEQMYMPIDPEDSPSLSDEDRVAAQDKAKTRKKLSTGERKNRHAQELREARKQVRDGLENWHMLFRGDKGKPYRRVGSVIRENGWLDKEPLRELCAQAAKGRPVRKYE